MNPSSPDPIEDPTAATQPHRLIYLTGYMGAGKSTIGRILARNIGYRFYDTDAVVVRGFGKPVSRIFEENGEEAFRKAEIMVLNELARRERTVISTGGGTLVRDDAYLIARESGTLVYLQAPVEHLYERVIFSPKDRPVVDVPDSEMAFRERFEARRPYYELSDFSVATMGRRPDAVVTEVIEKLGLPVVPVHERSKRPNHRPAPRRDHA